MTAATDIVRYANGRRAGDHRDELAIEEPLELRVEGHSIAVMMRTPGHDRELAAGFLLSEGIVTSAADIFDITTCVAGGTPSDGNVVDVALARPGSFDAAKLTRHVFTSSSCGICSRATIDAVMRTGAACPSTFSCSARMLLDLPARLSAEQTTFKRTGGLHGCALFDATGTLVVAREDVGRHNALDKLVGFALLAKKIPLNDYLVLLSGRASFEMMQKAFAAGIPMVAAISAPSSLAVEFARQSGMTLVGFVRGDSMNVYAGAARII